MPVVSSLLLTNFSSYSFTGELIVILVLLLLSALFAGSEVAFFSLRPAQLQYLRDEKPTYINKIILHLLDQPKKLLATILI